MLLVLNVRTSTLSSKCTERFRVGVDGILGAGSSFGVLRPEDSSNRVSAAERSELAGLPVLVTECRRRGGVTGS